MIHPVTLTITMNPNGTVTVNGPLEQKILCYGILEAAREAITFLGRDSGDGGGRRILPVGGPLIPVPHHD